ncbi:MAG: hypothetical protein NTY35_15335 [Planctomycetota bacterium]|nr:hypothetical protein [Planctomycetota bacterium]
MPNALIRLSPVLLLGGAFAAPAAAQGTLTSAQAPAASTAGGSAGKAAKAPAPKVYVKGTAPTGPGLASPIPTGGAALIGGSDACATPDVIAGSGPFLFDNSIATTGTQGQNEAACSFFGSTALNRDVWFRWTAGFTGNAELVACNHPVDTKIAVYSGAGCPSAPALACNDDFCGPFGLQSRVVFPATSGQTYVVQVGLYPFTTAGGQGSFTIQPASAPANDACGSPTPISGLGTFPFDNGFATSGAEGQSEVACNFFGSTAMVQDVWFRWTSTVNGTVIVDTCGGSIDTKIAVYSGPGCPVAPAIACNDDGCNFQSRVVFQAVSGAVYTFQVGLYPFGANGGAGSLRVSRPATNDACSAPAALFGTGTFPFDNGIASTGAEGQGNANCLEWGSTAIANDVWFSWTSPFSGTASISTCNQTVDTKLGVYAGLGCPAAPALACNDDACGATGYQSRLVFPVTAGAAYTLQVGTYPVGGGASGGTGTLDIQSVTPPSNDACSTPAPIVGAGPHPFDDTLATTGVQGQNEVACRFFGSTAIKNDLWFRWTSGFTGTAELSLCAGSGIDSKVAVYAGGGCPTGPALACNDDRCFLTSALCFPAVLGQTYTIQVGLYPNGGAAPGSGSFTLTPIVAGTTNDDCSVAAAIAGPGPHAFDTSTATTGCAGQDNLICGFAGISGIGNDVWFTWVAPSTARYQVSTCGTAGGQDGKIAVYAGAGCPLAPPVACDDDGCGTFAGEAQACFDAIAGQSYAIQVGTYPGAPGGPGTFAFSTLAVPAGCQHDNGSSEDAVGFTVNAALGWLQRFGSAGTTTSVSAISTAFGSPALAAQAPAVGTPITAALWDDPNDDGNPIDAVLLAQVAGVVTNRANDVLDRFALPAPVLASGVFFVGVVVQVTPNQRVAPRDDDGCPAGSVGRAFAVAQANGPFQFTNLAANSFPPTDLDAAGIPGVWLLRADCSGSVGAAYCFGDGSGTPCPCANSGASGNGCANSLNPAGARLQAVGSAVVGADTVALLGSGMPNSSALYFQGTTQLAVPFGDGLRCAGGSVVRLATKSNVSGASRYPSPGDPAVSVRGNVPPGSTRTYQVWYRNPAPFCTVSTFNLTNGLSLAWQ